MSLETLLRISVLHAELLGLAHDLSPEEQRIVAYSANVLRLLNSIPIDGEIFKKYGEFPEPEAF